MALTFHHFFCVLLSASAHLTLTQYYLLLLCTFHHADPLFGTACCLKLFSFSKAFVPLATFTWPASSQLPDSFYFIIFHLLVFSLFCHPALFCLIWSWEFLCTVAVEWLVHIWHKVSVQQQYITAVLLLGNNLRWPLQPVSSIIGEMAVV